MRSISDDDALLVEALELVLPDRLELDARQRAPAPERQRLRVQCRRVLELPGARPLAGLGGEHRELLRIELAGPTWITYPGGRVAIGLEPLHRAPSEAGKRTRGRP